jgi:phage/plasmid-associated DNA primase
MPGRGLHLPRRFSHPFPKAFSVAAKEYAGENDKLQAFIDDHCVTKGQPDLKVAKADFVEAFKNFLFAGGHDVGLARDGLTRAMRVKGFLQTSPGDGNAPMIPMLDKKSRGRGYFGIRLKRKKSHKYGKASC